MVRFLKRVYPIYVLVDLGLIYISFYSAYILKYNELNKPLTGLNLPHLSEHSFIFLLWFFFLLVFFRSRNLYTTDRSLNISSEAGRVILGVSYSTAITATVVFFSQYQFFSRMLFLEIFILLCALLSGWRLIKRIVLRRLIAAGFHNINVLIIGADKQGAIILEEIRRIPYYGLRVIGFLDENERADYSGVAVLGSFKDFPVVASKYFIDEILVTASAREKVIKELMAFIQKMHLGLRFIPDNHEEHFPQIKISYLGIVPLITYKERRHHPTEFFIKRFFDLIFSLLSLLILSPLFLLIAFLIKLDSKGPVFYMQERVGRKNKKFKFYKFRSMVFDADQLKQQLLEKNEVAGGVLFKMKNDPRITKLGLFIRKYSLDELPQLVNVLKGDMSLVGPRPPVPEEVKKYNHTQMQRLSIRPGITGLPQVKGRSGLTFRNWAKWDIWYVENWSFFLDMKILFDTIPAVLKGKGAY